MQSHDNRNAGPSSDQSPGPELPPAYRFLAITAARTLPWPREAIAAIHEFDQLSHDVKTHDSVGDFRASRPEVMERYLQLRSALDTLFDGAREYGSDARSPATEKELTTLWEVAVAAASPSTPYKFLDLAFHVPKDHRFAPCIGKLAIDFLDNGDKQAARTLVLGKNLQTVADLLPHMWAESNLLSDENFRYLVAITKRCLRRGHAELQDLVAPIQVGLLKTADSLDRTTATFAVSDERVPKRKELSTNLVARIKQELLLRLGDPEGAEVSLHRLLRLDANRSLLSACSGEIAVFTHPTFGPRVVEKALTLLGRAVHRLEKHPNERNDVQQGISGLMRYLSKHGMYTDHGCSMKVLDVLNALPPELISANSALLLRFYEKAVDSNYGIRIWSHISSNAPHLESSGLVAFATKYVETLRRDPKNHTHQTNGLLALEVLGSLGARAGSAVPAIVDLFGIDWSSHSIRTLQPLTKTAPLSSAELGARAVEALTAIAGDDRKVQSILSLLGYFSGGPVAGAAKRARAQTKE